MLRRVDNACYLVVAQIVYELAVTAVAKAAGVVCVVVVTAGSIAVDAVPGIAIGASIPAAIVVKLR